METMGAEGSKSFLPPGTAVRNKTVGGFVGEPVDLGLSVRWASWNVGACRPGEAGAYFAWGETDSCKDEYSWSTYRHLSQCDEGLVERNEDGGISKDVNWKHINKYTRPTTKRRRTGTTSSAASSATTRLSSTL